MVAFDPIKDRNKLHEWTGRITTRPFFRDQRAELWRKLEKSTNPIILRANFS